MLIEIHLLQNFAPSNLNRDDTGAPKDAEFGGHRRARISSQCLKRAMRTAMRDEEGITADELAFRTKRVLNEIADALVRAGRSEADARMVGAAALQSLGLELEDDKTQYLLFLGQREISALVDLCQQHWEALLGGAAAGKTKKGKPAVGDGAVARELKAALTGGQARDVALFGRMLAKLPEKNIHAAAQVAHALSTNRVSMEFDYFTAVDDLKPDDASGADMIGTVEFNSACFYRYANVDLSQLTDNLAGNDALAVDTLARFIRAAVRAIPTGKQNSMAAHNPPSLVLVVARRGPAVSLANAFVKPARATTDVDLIQASIRQLDDYWQRMATMYGTDDVIGAWACTTDPDALVRIAAAQFVQQTASVRELEQAVASAVGGAAARV